MNEKTSVQLLEQLMNSFVEFVDRSPEVIANQRLKDTVQEFLNNIIQPQFDALIEILENHGLPSTEIGEIGKLLNSRNIISLSLKKKIDELQKLENDLANLKNLEDLNYLNHLPFNESFHREISDAIALKQGIHNARTQSPKALETITQIPPDIRDGVRKLVALHEKVSGIELNAFEDIEEIPKHTRVKLKTLIQLEEKLTGLQNLDSLMTIYQIPQTIREHIKVLQDLEMNLRTAKSPDALTGLESISNEVRKKIRDLISLQERLARLNDLSQLSTLNGISPKIAEQLDMVLQRENAMREIENCSTPEDLMQRQYISAALKEAVQKLILLRSQLEQCKSFFDLSAIAEIPPKLREELKNHKTEIDRYKKNIRDLENLPNS